MRTLWNTRRAVYDFCSDLRHGGDKEALFRHMRGRVLFVAIGGGLDVQRFPPGRTIIGIDIDAEVLRIAAPRAAAYAGTLRLLRADAQHLCFPDHAFDTIATSCTMCTVPDPVAAFCELHRVLRPDGQLLMFEHVRSDNFLLGLVLDVMTLITGRKSGTKMNRRTLANAAAAGFQIESVEAVYLDIVLAVRAVLSQAPAFTTPAFMSEPVAPSDGLRRAVY